MHAANAIKLRTNCIVQHLYVPTHLRSARLHSLCIHAFCLISQLTAMFPLCSIDLLLLVIETDSVHCSVGTGGFYAGRLFNVDCKFGSDPV